MSYGFKVIRDADGIRLDEVSDGALEHIPHGTFTITGHHVTGAPGWSRTETIGIRHADADGNHRASATAEASHPDRGSEA